MTGNWLLEELIALSLPFRDMELRLGGLNYFLAAFGGTELARITGINPEAAAEVKSPGKISFWDNAFSRALVATRWIVIHEFGHIWDVNHLLATSFHLEQETGSRSCLAEILTHCKYQFNEAKSPISVYGQASRREDWADAFAAFMFGGSWKELLSSQSTNPHGVKDNPFNVAPNRIIFAATQIQDFKANIDFWNKNGSEIIYWGMVAGGFR